MKNYVFNLKLDEYRTAVVPILATCLQEALAELETKYHLDSISHIIISITQSDM